MTISMPEPAGAGAAAPAQRLALIGCPLDPDEREPALQEKLEIIKGALTDDPYERVVDLLRKSMPAGFLLEAGNMDIPGWLKSIPQPADMRRMDVGRFVQFIDSGGCLAWADKVAALAEGLYPDIPCLIAADHSMAGGLMKAAAGRHSPSEITFVVLDSHTDAVSVEITRGLIEYDMENNPRSLYDPDDPYLRGRAESYNAGTFLLSLLNDGYILPQNLIIIGASDTPPKRAARIKDRRVGRFVESYETLLRSGVRVFSKEDVISGPSRLKAVLGSIKTPLLYISIDMDIGAGNALNAVRFTERTGLNERQILGIISQLASSMAAGVGLAGMDVCEFNPRKGLLGKAPARDRTYEIAASIIEAAARPALGLRWRAGLE